MTEKSSKKLNMAEVCYESETDKNENIPLVPF